MVTATEKDSAPPRPTLRPEEYFSAPAVQQGVFELALVLGGTVSAGTFTAGVLDFLFQALDEWDKARAEKRSDVAQHRVRIRIITGASGGGINAVLAARALHYSFPHATASATDVKNHSPSSNPFYEVWVNEISIDRLLDTSDLDTKVSGKEAPIVSILNGNVLTEVAERSLGAATETQNNEGAGQSLSGFPSNNQAGVTRINARSWIYNPLTVIVTHTNLGGVPYSQMFTSASPAAASEYFTNHADYVRLYFGYSASADSPSPGIRYLPDAKFVNVPNGEAAEVPVQFPAPTPWSALSQNVLGTSAFPIGFPARAVSRDGANYAYRFAWNSLAGRYDWLTPLWPKVAQQGKLTAYSFLSLDGGCTDNEPIMLASQVLEGLDRTPHHANRASGVEANRAIVLVDPLVDPLPSVLPADGGPPPLISLLSPTLQMFIQSSRFATADIAGFLSKDVYNRFLIAPKRTDKQASTFVGGDALCAEGMGAFMGFLCKEFRHHDFMLGRRNCQAFLSGTFTLPGDNPLFRGNPPLFEDPDSANFPRPQGDEFAIIPLYGTAAMPQDQVNWPAGAFKPEEQKVKRLLEKRLSAMLERLGRFLDLPWTGRELANVFDHIVIGPAIASKVMAYIDGELARKKLL
ncbi:patatin-like phospholipase family protein [Paraburkholderia flagellata]|uniref:patatin-like phospholipase family protein n=1 Tax=Paraburkholderia flagellata TaxID=2883241 RepID=UPI001F24D1D4|nr:patatin-like phospholipase family protein [Paraburkholderia flagellata]